MTNTFALILLTNLKGRTLPGAFITSVAQGAQFVLDAPPRRQLRSVGAISRLRQADQSWELEVISMTSRTSASLAAGVLRKAGVPDESFRSGSSPWQTWIIPRTNGGTTAKVLRM